MKKILTYLSLAIAFNLMTVNLVWAESATTTLQEVQEGTQNLINAKDQENPTPEEEQKLRLEIFTKVIDLSLKEAEDIINQLNALKNLNEAEVALRDQLLEKFNGFLQFYNEQKESLTSTSTEELDLTSIKKLAQDFKDWRENVYLPVFETATDFLLINQQKVILEMTEKRYQKISLDIAKLKKANLAGIDQLEKYLNQAVNLIETAKALWQETQDRFWQEITINSSEETASSTATSSIITPASTSTPTSTLASAEDQLLSIKNLISDSLNKIKEAYRIFIEMSNLVRKLLL